jgi:hypothetical protein
VWFYFDVRGEVQGPFVAREMIGWVASAMLKEDTRVVGAEPGTTVRGAGAVRARGDRGTLA